MARTVSIHYRRIPDSEQVFRQTVLDDNGPAIVTFLASAELEKPVVVAGRNVLEPSAPVIWFTYPDRWYDIGLFHLADGTFTGYYANILTPVQMNDDVWHTTDLCLDVWAGADGNVELLDQEEFAEAVERGWMDERCAAIARTTAADLMAAAVDGSWPTREVREWDLARVKLSH